MREFRFKVWPYGEVIISQPSGVPGEHFWVSLNGYHYGSVVKQDGKWIGYLNPKGEKELSRDDIQAIGYRIDLVYPDG